MSQEIEKKYLVKTIPQNLNIKDSKTIYQTYLAIGDEEIRIRKTVDENNEEFVMTIKQGNGLVRLENEFPIEKDTYNQLLQKDAIQLVKTRKTIVIQDKEFELDTYHNLKDWGMMTIEIEFKSEEEALSFVPPLWFGEDVTGDKKYKNQSLWASIQPRLG